MVHGLQCNDYAVCGKPMHVLHLQCLHSLSSDCTQHYQLLCDTWACVTEHMCICTKRRTLCEWLLMIWFSSKCQHRLYASWFNESSATIIIREQCTRSKWLACPRPNSTRWKNSQRVITNLHFWQNQNTCEGLFLFSWYAAIVPCGVSTHDL